MGAFLFLPLCVVFMRRFYASFLMPKMATRFSVFSQAFVSQKEKRDFLKSRSIKV